MGDGVRSEVHKAGLQFLLLGLCRASFVGKVAEQAPWVVLYLLFQMGYSSRVSVVYRSKLLPTQEDPGEGLLRRALFKVLKNAWCFEIYKACVGFSKSFMRGGNWKNGLRCIRGCTELVLVTEIIPR